MRSPLADPDGIDFLVIRENSEGIYPGREGDVAEAKRALPDVRDRFGRGLDRFGDGRFAVKVVTRAGAERVARFACEFACRRKAKGFPGKVTCVTKSNVLPQTDGLFHATVRETVAAHPDLVFEHFHVDDAARRIIRFPRTLDVRSERAAADGRALPRDRAGDGRGASRPRLRALPRGRRRATHHPVPEDAGRPI